MHRPISLFLGRCSLTLMVVLALTLDCDRAMAEPAIKEVDFARDIQPILANHCWNCHGRDDTSRQADLRLDIREVAIERSAIDPGNEATSEIISRIHTSDPELLMPPASYKKPLTDHQKEMLGKWIREGAPYKRHWAFDPPIAVAIPSPAIGQQLEPVWNSNPIDAFVLERLEQEQLKPAALADRATLLRRLSLDLTGLPPTLQELEQFEQDDSNDAYERVVDRLLASKRYAERMAMNWLDLARYADTNGYNNDQERTMWPWRDWVIQAYDSNMPLDQFILEQLAGDLVPNATLDQQVATAFLRNHGNNTEGGIVPEEYRVEYVADRVHTAATVFLGLSMQCARCHDHKFDPISQAEYYQFYAFFNNVDENHGNYSNTLPAAPYIRVPSAKEVAQLQTIEQELTQLNVQIQDREAGAMDLLGKWVSDHSVEEFQSRFGVSGVSNFDAKEFRANAVRDPIAGVSTSTVFTSNDGEFQFDNSVYVDLGSTNDVDGTKPFSISVWVYPSASQPMAILSKMDESSNFRGYDLLLEEGKVSVHLIHQWPTNALKVMTKQPVAFDQWHHVVVAYDGKQKSQSVQVFVDAKLQELNVIQDSLTETIATDKSFHVGRRQSTLPFQGMIKNLHLYRVKLEQDQVQQSFEQKPISGVGDWIALPNKDRTEEQRQRLSKVYLTNLDDIYSQLQLSQTNKVKERTDVENLVPGVMVMKEMPVVRPTFVLKRGQYDQPSIAVSANVPAVINSLTSNQPLTRLDLAKWLVDPRHPLTARVAINRWWQNYFGIGLVKTSEDFGITGEAPSHPELLDYLATQLIASGWNTKAMQKLIVMSATYRQDSAMTPEIMERDPENRLLARGPRFRLAAETVRDNALSISGLLSDRISGPSVRPYQPPGLWEDVSVERKATYVPDKGQGLYRRSMYTFWKRTCPPPSMMSFDAPNREVCLIRRARTNTPLQSLVLLNDPTYLEAARVLAWHMIQDGGDDIETRLNVGYRRCLARNARANEVLVLSALLEKSRQRFAEDAALAVSFIAIGDTPVDTAIDPVELASWTVIASTLLNLDETISKR